MDFECKLIFLDPELPASVSSTCGTGTTAESCIMVLAEMKHAEDKP